MQPYVTNLTKIIRHFVSFTVFWNAHNNDVLEVPIYFNYVLDYYELFINWKSNKTFVTDLSVNPKFVVVNKKNTCDCENNIIVKFLLNNSKSKNVYLSDIDIHLSLWKVCFQQFI